MSKDDIVDTTLPSSGRMYDYYLGGSHNFEVDRIAADKVIKILPFLVNFTKLQRWSLQEIAEELTLRRGYDVIIDFASGLPTADHIHNRVPAGTTVIYSDKDPVVVRYSQEIIQGIPNVYCFENDVARPEELLNHPDVIKILNGRRKVAISFWGISGFLYDEEISHAMQILYDWAAPGSCMAFNAQAAGFDPNHPGIAQMLKIYESFGQESHLRTLSQFTDLIKPWKMDEKGWVSLFDWHGFDKSELSKDDQEAFGPMGGGFGSYLTK